MILAVALLFWVAFVLGMNLSIPVFLLILYIYYRQRVFKNISFLYLLFLCVLNFSISYFVISRGLPTSLLPFALMPMLATILFGSFEISLLITLSCAVSIASVASNHFSLGIMFLTSGILSSILVMGTRRRMTVIRAGFIVGIVQALMLFFIDQFWVGLPARYINLVFNGIISSVIVLGVLPLFEYLFKTVTNISLLELADFNHPLLQRMIMEAPGTYHHSLIVGNLSDAASTAIGANGLLSRIGAYYHDIGKIEKSEYFSENQAMQENKHDDLSPTMSKLVIMNHVKEGVELAKKYRLNSRLIDFIQQHHGNSLVYYFYCRALENLEEDQQVKEEGFRYPGPKANTKETAIVLLADSVEAACRALKDHSPGKIGELVYKVINNKFIDRQLDECDLTLKDLEKIAEVFIHILSGIYHSRVTYPESAVKSEDNHKKSAEETSRQPDKDKKSGA